MDENILLSVVVPVYNEADKIEKNLKIILEYLKGRYTYEVIVVDDGSRDDTYAIASRIGEKDPCIKLLKNEVNCGKGYTLKKGMTAASGKYVLFTDADLSTPFEELDKLLPYFSQGYDIVVGSRKLKDSVVQVHQARHREFMGRIFYMLAKAFVTGIVRDFNCGFKCYRREVAHRLYGISRLERWGFDVELFFLAEKYGYKIKEVPVRWLNSSTTKVRLFKDSLNSFLELVQIRINDMQGLYADEK